MWHGIRGGLQGDTFIGSTLSLIRMSHLADVVKMPPPRPPNQEVIIEEEYAREHPDPLQVIWNIYDIVEEVLCKCVPHPYYHNMFMRIDVNY